MKAFEGGFCGCLGVCGAVIAVIVGLAIVSMLLLMAPTANAHPGPDIWTRGNAPNACFKYHERETDDKVMGRSWHCHTDAEWNAGYEAMRPAQGYPNGTAGAPGHAPSAFRSVGGELQINTGADDWCPVGQRCN